MEETRWLPCCVWKKEFVSRRETVCSLCSRGETPPGRGSARLGPAPSYRRLCEDRCLLGRLLSFSFFFSPSTEKSVHLMTFLDLPARRSLSAMHQRCWGEETEARGGGVGDGSGGGKEGVGGARRSEERRCRGAGAGGPPLICGWRWRRVGWGRGCDADHCALHHPGTVGSD